MRPQRLSVGCGSSFRPSPFHLFLLYPCHIPFQISPFPPYLIRLYSFTINRQGGSVIVLQHMHSKAHNRGEDLLAVEKTLRLEDEALSARFDILKLSFEYRPSNRSLCFDSALRLLCKQGYPLQGCQIFFWDHVRRIFVFIGCFPSQTEMVAPYEYFQENVIHLKFKKVVKQAERDADRAERQDVSKRVKERSIQEATDKVNLWMKIYEQTGPDGKRLFTLDSAAKEVGVAKKTLDDYKTQLRLGQKYRFDFHKHRQSKIGILRNFVKTGAALFKDTLPLTQPNPDPLVKMQAEASSMSSDEESQGYLFHETHSCYSETGSSHD